MVYLGSKRRIAKYILPIILKGRAEGQWYVEPFCGGMNTIDKVDGLRIANDSNIYLMHMWKELLEGTLIPREYSKEEYMAIKAYYKANKDSLLTPNLGEIGYVGFNCSYCAKWFGGYVDILYKKDGSIKEYQQQQKIGNITKQLVVLKHSLGEIGYAGFNCSYGGAWMRGYANETPKQSGVTQFYQKNMYDNITKQVEILKEQSTLILFCGGYEEMDIPPNSIIYCDPPYQNTTSYSAVDAFDHNAFWQWCREKTIEGHKVFISEYNAPDDFECVWSKELYNAISKSGSNKPIEKLFIYKGDGKGINI